MENQNHEYKLNFLATVYPKMSEEVFDRLCEDIKKDGLYNPITLYKGEIIDGRHRYLACKKLGIEPKFITLPDDKDPLNYVVSQNQTRRDIKNDTELALHLLELPRVANGTNRHNTLIKNEGLNQLNPKTEVDKLYTLEMLAEATGISITTLIALDKIRLSGTPELAEAVIEKKVSIKNGQAIALLPKEKQLEAVEILNTGDKKEIAKIHKEVNDEKHKNKIDKILAKKNAIYESLKDIPLIEQNKVLGHFEKSYILGRSEDELKKLADNSIDLILTDPPYSQNYLNTKKKIKTLPTDYGIENDTEEDLESIKAVAEQCYRVLKAGRHLYWFGNIMYVEPQRQMLEEIGFSVENILIWEKENHTLCNNIGFLYRYEIVIYAVKKVDGVETRVPTKKELGKEDTQVSDILPFKRVEAEFKLHSHQKPQELLQHLIGLSSYEKETVLDPFAGSGSTLIASLESGRYAIGYEMSEKFHTHCLKGWQIEYAKKEQKELDLGELQ